MRDGSHYFRPYAKAMLERSNPDMNKDRVEEERQRDRDQRFVRELALAFLRGDHLPAGEPRELRLIG